MANLTLYKQIEKNTQAMEKQKKKPSKIDFVKEADATKIIMDYNETLEEFKHKHARALWLRYLSDEVNDVPPQELFPLFHLYMKT